MVRKAAAALVVVLAITAVLVYVERRRITASLPCVTGRWDARCRQALDQVADGSRSQVRCMLRSPAEVVRFRSGSLGIVADLLEPARRGNGEAVVLLHGSSAYGRQLPLNRILASQLRAKGYTVLAIDFRGFGESEDPADVTAAASFDYADDVRAAVQYLGSRYGPSLRRIHVVGHSLGGGAALAASSRGVRPATMALIGPPRRLQERFLAPGAPDSSYYLVRAQQDMQLAEIPGYDAWAAAFRSMDIERHIDDFSGQAHVPLLLIDNEREDSADLAFLREVHQRMSPHVQHWTVPDTDHYLNTGLLLGMACYNRGVIRGFVDRLDAWMQGHSPNARPSPRR